MSGPSAEFRAHHDVAAPRVDADAFRQGWRVTTRLDGLLADGLITAAGYGAALRWRRDWELAFGSAPARAYDGPRAAPGPSGGPIPRLAALGRLRAAESALGGFATGILIGLVARDMAWRRLAAGLGCEPATARRWAVVMIEGLAAHYRQAAHVAHAPQSP